MPFEHNCYIVSVDLSQSELHTRLAAGPFDCNEFAVLNKLCGESFVRAPLKSSEFISGSEELFSENTRNQKILFFEIKGR